MLGLLKLFFGLACLAAFAWWGLTVPLGERSLFGHLQAIGQSKESQELVRGTKQKVGDLTKRFQEDEAKGAGDEDKGGDEMEGEKPKSRASDDQGNDRPVKSKVKPLTKPESRPDGKTAPKAEVKAKTDPNGKTESKTAPSKTAGPSKIAQPQARPTNEPKIAPAPSAPPQDTLTSGDRKEMRKLLDGARAHLSDK